MSHRTRDHAVVVGGSIAGLLAARVLSESYVDVTVLDRDELAADGAARRGVPQARHIHALLAGGQQVLERLFPGLTTELASFGAPVGDALADTRLVFGGHRLASAHAGLTMVSASRTLLEARIRARVASLPGVRFAPASDAVGLRVSSDQRRITGVRQLRRTDGSVEETIDADVVVDASGRNSRAPMWLDALGFIGPGEQRVAVDVGYATRRYRLAPDTLDGAVGFLQGPTPDRLRGGALTRLEDDVWMLTVFGLLGDHPPICPSGFDGFAGTLEAPEVHRAIGSGVPIDDPVPFRFPANVRRRYELRSDLPHGFVVIGDAMCSFNPIYGQGMTVAALQADALRNCLRDGDRDLAHRFHQAAAHVVEVAWRMATGADLALPDVEGRRTVQVRVLNAYTKRLLALAARDANAAVAFLRVAGMVDPPPTLLRPGLAIRVLRPGRHSAQQGPLPMNAAPARQVGR
jgi:2-polyprenyl-6-methoxyphenol hydroxylase-like FAD-dependent oxidoreductase